MTSTAIADTDAFVPRPALAGTAKAGPPARVLSALAREERFGIKLACIARLVAISVIEVWVIIQNWQLGLMAIGYFVLVLGGFAAIGVAHLWLSGWRHRRPWHPYLLCAIDFCLLAYIIITPAPGQYGAAFPLPMLLRWDNELYFFVIMAGYALTFSPLLLLWSGVVAALAWTGAVLSIALRPPAFGIDLFGLDATQPEAWLPVVLDPNYVNPNAFITQIVVLIVTSGILALGVWRARRLVFRQVEVERERTNLARYFSPNMIDELARADQPLGAVKSQDAAVLFADIVGFTHLSETLPPEQTMALLRDFHGRMAEAVFAHGGTLDKYIGDAVMATFGTPTPGPRDATNALSCAVAMQDAVARWNRQRRSRAAPEIRVGIGVHYGPVVLGDIGGEQRFEFAVIGDTVNVASRLERLTRDLDLGIVVADALVRQVRREVGDGADAALQGFVEHPGRSLRGRVESVDLWGLPRPAAP
ncbi:MAG: adenylate/guanylate cyclase domain-containing protein [Alphaproteobacteria bacterium]